MRLTTVEHLEPGDVVLGLDEARGEFLAYAPDSEGRWWLTYRTPAGRELRVRKAPHDEVTIR